MSKQSSAKTFIKYYVYSIRSRYEFDSLHAWITIIAQIFVKRKSFYCKKWLVTVVNYQIDYYSSGK